MAKAKIDQKKLLYSLNTSFISRQISSDVSLMPSLLVNDSKRQKKILTSLEEEMKTCEAFDFSVAFINNEGIASIKLSLDYLALYNIKGRILTTNYLNFTQPSALRELLCFPNIEVRAYTKGGFHPKGYIFKQSNYSSIIIGSANLTASALTQNQEWSIKLLSCLDGQIVYTVQEEFENVWNQAEVVNDEWIENYSKIYELKKVKLSFVNKEFRKKIKELKNDMIGESLPLARTSLLATLSSGDTPQRPVDSEAELEFYTENEDLIESDTDEQFEIIPNSMQKEAMVALDDLRSKGENRALLIAATGTGKTYLSIFDVNQVKPKKVLYVAHRDMILNKSEKSFKTVLPEINTGFLNGKQKDIDADYLFASVFTLAKNETLHSFKKDAFDYIIIDEVHHAGAESYKKIIDYFTPKFLLGLTATPERTDGFDIFNLFHNNIPYEIRLQKAMEEDLLCPFNYYGLSDLTVNGEVIDEKSDFTKLVCNERIKHIEKAINLYRNFAYPVKGLMFCSRVEEAKELSKKLNADGFVTKYLTGENTDSERETVIEELESDDNPLQYIISVDIFNEGVDIPSVNQVVMLRPTQSAIIFVQQLGRGLRKAKGKTYVSVIDFIGNYENNFFIPIALFGDNSYNKDNLRKVMSIGSAGLPGTSTVQINEVARQKIFDSINQTSFRQLKILKEEYNKLRMRLARIPAMMDFVNNGFIDPFLFIDYAGSYYAFKKKVEKDFENLDTKQQCSLTFFSVEFARGIRLHELLLISSLLNQEKISLDSFKDNLASYNVKLTENDFRGMLRLLSPEFYTQNDQKKYGNITYVKFQENNFFRTDEFSALLKSELYKAELKDCLEYGIKRATLKPEERIEDNNLILYRKYSRKDICKVLNWMSDCSSTIYGYKTETSTAEYTCPIFVTYEKSENISETTKYEDEFIDDATFNWMSRSRRTSKSEEVAALIDQPNNHIKIMLFVKKSDGEGSDFYYMGKMKYSEFKDTTMNGKDGTDIPVVNIKFNMETPVPQTLYNYLTA